MSEPDFDALARQFVYDEVKAVPPAEAALKPRLQWGALMDCFEAWLRYREVRFDQNRSLRSRALVEAMIDAGLPRSGSKGKYRVPGAALYVGSPEEFLADIEECLRLDATG